ncbi:MAG: O-antigen ligase family protein [Ardenticatenales bacterium]|nr:O-antigen ligase family protein [Ardenticatenales bacterium]
MKGSGGWRWGDPWLWVEGSVLLLAAPFLLFPTQFYLGTCVTLLLLAGVWLWRCRHFPSTPFNLPLLLWSLALIAGILVTADPDLTLPKATGLILGLGVWRFAARYITDERRLRWVGLAYLLLGLGFAALGAFSANWYTKVPFLRGVVALLPANLLQLPGSPDTGVQLNQLAGTLILLLPLLLSLSFAWPIKNRRDWLWRGGFLLLTLGLGVLLLLSQSRSGWLGMIAGIFTSLALWRGMAETPAVRRRLTALLAALLLGGLLLALSIGPARWQQIIEEPPRETAIGTLGTIRFRLEVWQWAVAGIQDFPFTGTGLGSFRQVVHRFYPINTPLSYDIAHAHNIFLQVALDLGLPGLVAYLALLLLAGVIGWQAARRAPPLRPWAIGLLAGLVALHVYGLADALAPGSKPALLFWLALGLLAGMSRLKPGFSEKPGS